MKGAIVDIHDRILSAIDFKIKVNVLWVLRKSEIQRMTPTREIRPFLACELLIAQMKRSSAAVDNLRLAINPQFDEACEFRAIGKADFRVGKTPYRDLLMWLPVRNGSS